MLTHTHTPLRRWLLATFIAILMLPMIGKSQNSCLTAEFDNPVTNTQEVTRLTTKSSYWLTFNGDSTKKYHFYTYINDSLSIQESPIVSLYKDNCDSLNLILQDTMAITFDNMATGVRYYVKTTFEQDTIEFKYFSSFSPKQIFTDCDSTSCDYLKNGNFTYLDPILNGNSFNVPGKFANGGQYLHDIVAHKQLILWGLKIMDMHLCGQR